jgi:hypothetical protein
MIRPHLLTAFALIATLTGCGSDTPSAASSESTPATATSSSAIPPSTSSPGGEPLPLGTAYTFQQGTMTTTALQYNGSIAETLGGLEVRTCNLPGASKAQQVSVASWSLQWADGTRTVNTWSGVVSDEYPYHLKAIDPGKCVQGWVVFSAPQKDKPALAVYGELSTQGEHAEWKLS